MQEAALDTGCSQAFKRDQCAGFANMAVVAEANLFIRAVMGIPSRATLAVPMLPFGYKGVSLAARCWLACCAGWCWACIGDEARTRTWSSHAYNRHLWTLCD
jgi:hypothetical protein